VKDTVVKESSGEKLGKLVDACKKAGIDIAEVFDVADKVVAKDNLLQNQYKLPKTTLQEFRSLVRPWKPSLKTDVSR
jgi:soluble P-type ATPase